MRMLKSRVMIKEETLEVRRSAVTMTAVWVKQDEKDYGHVIPQVRLLSC